MKKHDYSTNLYVGVERKNGFWFLDPSNILLVNSIILRIVNFLKF